MAYCRECGDEMYSDHMYCGDCANEIVEQSRSRIRCADENEQRMMRNDRDYAHRWLQDLIGWIAGLMGLMSKICGAGCYITSAVVEFKGLGDQSQEMLLLRQFREEYIEDSHIPERTTDLEHYYVIGAVLRNWIDSRADRVAIWEYVWCYVSRVINLIRESRGDEAYSLFRNRTLALRWDVLGGLHLQGPHFSRFG